MKKTIKIANGQGFWGDSIDAPYNLIKYGNIDYLTLDYLAEVTLSIMQRQKIKNPEKYPPKKKEYKITEVSWWISI